jgi:hypothetical protein
LTYLRPSSDHIPLHRLWMFSTLQVDMIMPDHAHLLDCEECRTGLRVCLKAGSFASVLKQLKPVDYAEHQATSTLQISQEETDDEVVAAIVSLFTVAVRGGSLADSGEREPSLGLRIRATRALALFLPHHEARTGLIALMTSDDIPAEIQEVAAQAFQEQH